MQVEEENGSISEFFTQLEVQSAIWTKIHQERCHMAEEAPICRGWLHGDFGYHAHTKSGNAVLHGEYSPGFDLHEGTQCIFQSIENIHKLIPCNAVGQIINRETWQKHGRTKRSPPPHHNWASMALHVWCNLWSNFLLTCAQNIHCTVSSNWTREIAIWAMHHAGEIKRCLARFKTLDYSTHGSALQRSQQNHLWSMYAGAGPALQVRRGV